jgi:diacylglycerol kinase
MWLVKRALRKWKSALYGIYAAVRGDLSVKFNIVIGILLIVFGYLVRPLTLTEAALLLFSWMFLFITELQNTALETALDRLHPEEHADIGKSKDIAAASVITAFCAVVLIVGVIILIKTHVL